MDSELDWLTRQASHKSVLGIYTSDKFTKALLKFCNRMWAIHGADGMDGFIQEFEGSILHDRLILVPPDGGAFAYLNSEQLQFDLIFAGGFSFGQVIRSILEFRNLLRRDGLMCWHDTTGRISKALLIQNSNAGNIFYTRRFVIPEIIDTSRI